jgi:hypothetical protein
MRYAHLAPGHQRENVGRLMQYVKSEGDGKVVKMKAVGGRKRR